MSSSLLLFLACLQTPPEPIVIPPPPPIAGVVVDAEGRPVASADVFLVDILIGKRGEERLWEGRTDAQGRFSAERPRGSRGWSLLTQVYAYRDGMPPIVQRRTSGNLSSPGEPVKLVLRAATALKVRLVRPGGEPLHGARISYATSFEWMLLPERLRARLTATTGADGRAQLPPSLPEGHAALFVEAPGFGSQTFPLGDRRVPELTLTLRPVGRVSGRVVAEDPAQARGVVVSGSMMQGPTFEYLRSAGAFQVTTDAEGRFDLPAVPVGQFWAPTIMGVGQTSIVSRSGSNQNLEPGGHVELKIPLGKLVPVRGSLVDRETGRPISGAWLNVESKSGGGYSIVPTDAQGRYEAMLTPGIIGVALHHAPSYVLASELPSGPASTLARGAEALELPTLELIKAIDVRGVVRDESGAPAAGAVVEVMGVDANLRDDSHSVPNIHADSRGEFVVTSWRPGRPMALTAWAGEAASGPAKPVVPDGKSPVVLVVSPANTRSVGGRVVDEAGKPVAGAKVAVYSTRQLAPGKWAERFESFGRSYPDYYLVTDAQGRFETPRKLLRHDEFYRAEARVTGLITGRSEWYAATTPSLFDLVVTRPPPADQAELRHDADVAEQALKENNPGQAVILYETIIKTAEQKGIPEKDPRTFARWLSRLATAQLKSGKRDESFSIAHRAFELRKKALGPNDPDLAESFSQLGDVCWGQWQLSLAEDSYDLAMKARELLYGTSHPQYARDEANHAWVVVCRERENKKPDPARFQAADGELSHVISVDENALGPENVHLGVVLGRRGVTRTLLDRNEQAEADLRRALAISERNYGPNHSFVATLLQDLAPLLRKSGRQAEAETMETRARAIRGR